MVRAPERWCKMQTIIQLAEEFPWIMAPASLIAAMVVISVFVIGVRIFKEEGKMMVALPILVLTLWAMVMYTIIN